jgi:hypothetical protein
MATFVLVPGGGHGGWCCYQRVKQRIAAAGHLMITEPQFVADVVCEIAAA